jgi:uncharacterized protein YutE (UPF0331/DUF86 family)
VSPGKVDRDSVRRHLLALDETLTQLGRHTGRPVEALSGDVDERWTVERGLQLCVQNVLDLATHLVASAGRDVPDYTTAIEQLGTLRIIPTELAAKLRPLAGFRNALVHGYIGVDLALVHAVLNQHLSQVREFAGCVERYIQTLPVEPQS